jgi:hypothetical protein
MSNHIKEIDEDDINMSEITILKHNKSRPPEGILVRHRLVEYGTITRSFARVVFDEVHRRRSEKEW